MELVTCLNASSRCFPVTLNAGLADTGLGSFCVGVMTVAETAADILAPLFLPRFGLDWCDADGVVFEGPSLHLGVLGMMIQVFNCCNSVSCLYKKLEKRVKHELSCGRLLSYWILKVLDCVPMGVNGCH